MSEVRCVLKVENKADWHSIYIQSTPVPYFDTMSPVDYGHYHDRFLEIINVALAQKNIEFLKVVEVGTSYGNTTLAYRYGLDWQKTGEFWKDESQVIGPIRSMEVTACDMSIPALTYGQRRGVFDTIIPFDFNTLVLPNELSIKLVEGDLLVLIMISSYIKTLSFQRICLNFLGDRSKQKVIVYNDTPVFDDKNFTPEFLFAGIKGWSTKTTFTKHRDFTPEERLKQHGSKESWSFTYVVAFEALSSEFNK